MRDFDGMALYEAMDAKRYERGLSWRQVAQEIWDQSAMLNRKRQDHPINPSTLRESRVAAIAHASTRCSSCAGSNGPLRALFRRATPARLFLRRCQTGGCAGISRRYTARSISADASEAFPGCSLPRSFDAAHTS